MADISTPDFTGVVDQQFLLAREGGSESQATYLDLFPDEVYNKAIDSHLVKLVYTLLGPAGIGWLRSNYFQARLALEEYGLSNFELDRFYGDPLKFGRILEEVYDEDPSGLVSREAWDKIKAKDNAYRARALDYITGVRAGGTPLGMKYVARSGIGHEVEIFERYRWLYDQLSDDPIGIPDIGSTGSTEEMVIIPRRELPQNESQLLTISGSPTGGSIKLFYPVGDEATNQTSDIAHNATAGDISLFLEAIPTIGPGNILVEGGPLPAPVKFIFTGSLANADLPKLQVLNFLSSSSGEIVTAVLKTVTDGISANDEIVQISPRDQKYLQSALSRIKPVTAIPTFEAGKTLRGALPFNSVHATSQLAEVVRYVTGKQGVKWPETANHWIRAGVELEAPKGFRHTALSYVGYHEAVRISSYGDEALLDPDYPSSPYPSTENGLAEAALASPSEVLRVTTSTTGAPVVGLVNGIYPSDYQGLAGLDDPQTSSTGFWASQNRSEGSDYLEIDLGSVKAINAISFEISHDPFDLEVSYDVLDQAPRRSWAVAALDPIKDSKVGYGYGLPADNPWEDAQVFFSTPSGSPIFTRFLRLKFQRRVASLSPYGCRIRNLRVQRNVH